MSQTADLASLVARKVGDRANPQKTRGAPANIPAQQVLTALFDVLFFASIKTEEGRSIQVRIFYVDPNNPDPEAPPYRRIDRWQIFPLASRLPFTVAAVVKLAKAADPWASGLAIFHTDADGLFIWGMVDQVVHISMALVQESVGGYTPPGEFYALINGAADITVFREDSFIARLAQDQLLEKQNDCLWEGYISDLIDEWTKPIWTEVFKKTGPKPLSEWRQLWKHETKKLWIKTLSRILINIQRQRHGGAILFCPQTARKDLSVKYELPYKRVAQAMKEALYCRILLRHNLDEMEIQRFNGIKNIPSRLYSNEVVLGAENEDAERTLTGAVRFISSMAGVDGLILASPGFAVRGFGVEIRTKQEITDLSLAGSADLKTIRIINADSFGTRHRSMARYCAANPSSLGFVVSQDGDIRAITKVKDRTVLFENVKVQSLWDDDLPKMIKAMHPRRTKKSRSSSTPT